MKKLFLLLFLLATRAFSADVSFTATTAEIPNPGRGFYAWCGAQYLNSCNNGSLAGVFSSGDRLTLGVMDLSAYRTTPTLPQSLLDLFNSQLALVRANHLQIILRPAYNYSSTGSDATTAISLGHIAQLAPVLQANADVIAVFQEGTFGPFGEAWDGANTIVRTAAERAQLHAAVAAAAHPYTNLANRYMKHIIASYPSAISYSTAFNGSAASRFTAHNDCIGAGTNDSGSFSSSNVSITANPERARLANDALYVPFGGEGCDNAGTPTRQACAIWMPEQAQYHMTYLNRSYPAAWITQWQSEGCYAELRRSLGYRLQLDRVTHADTVGVNTPTPVNVYMRNVGWGGVYDPRYILIRATKTGTTYGARGYSDLRLEMKPGNNYSSKLPVQLTLPTSGTYNLEICMPSPWKDSTGALNASFIAADVNYNIRPANATNGGQTWNATSGCFATGTSITAS